MIQACLIMDYEKPQKGNPHQLTINQHCFPVRSISRFTKDNGCVDVYLISQNKTVQFKPRNKIFCVKRIWHQSTETGTMKRIEDVYQELAEDVIKDKITTLKPDHQGIITDMYLLWFFRCYYANQKNDDLELNNIAPPNYTKDEEELLEKNNVHTCPGGIIKARSCVGLTIQFLFDSFNKDLISEWEIFKTFDGELLVPDKPTKLQFLPLTPNKCFLSLNEVHGLKSHKINKISVQYSSNYYFARDLSRCPK